MKCSTGIIASVLLGMSSLQPSAVKSSFVPPAAPGLNADLKVSEGELRELEERALGGDGLVALKLSIYFRAIKDDRSREDYWTTISAEDGNTVGETNLCSMLYAASVKEQEPEMRRRLKLRAVYWANQALRSSGVSKERELRERIKAMKDDGR